jgi:hypothetical protein
MSRRETIHETDRIRSTRDAGRVALRTVARIVTQIYQGGNLPENRSCSVILACIDRFRAMLDTIRSKGSSQTSNNVGDLPIVASIFAPVPTLITLPRWSLHVRISQEEVGEALFHLQANVLGFGKLQAIQGDVPAPGRSGK